MSYIESNRLAYEAAATEYPERAAGCSDAQLNLIALMQSILELLGKTPPLDVLELGPGAGNALKEMSDRGHRVTAIEFSPAMAAVAQRTAPDARIIVDEFLSHNFNGETFDSVYMVAFLHLFSSFDAEKVLQKSSQLIGENGVIVMSTSIHDASSEGFEVKEGFEAKVERYRHRYTKDELDALVKSVGLTALSYTENDGHEKRWGNYILALR